MVDILPRPRSVCNPWLLCTYAVRPLVGQQELALQCIRHPDPASLPGPVLHPSPLLLKQIEIDGPVHETAQLLLRDPDLTIYNGVPPVDPLAERGRIGEH